MGEASGRPAAPRAAGDDPCALRNRSDCQACSRQRSRSTERSLRASRKWIWNQPDQTALPARAAGGRQSRHFTFRIFAGRSDQRVHDLVEVICGWPGLGPLVLEATFSRDFYVVIGGIMLSALFMVVGNLIADIMLIAFDPRKKDKKSRMGLSGGSRCALRPHC